MSWYQQTVGGDSENAVASKSGVKQQTLNRQLKAGKLSPETVVAVAHAYKACPIEALVSLGLLTDEDIRAHGVRVALSRITDKEIADEVWKRLVKGSHPYLENPISAPQVAIEVNGAPNRKVRFVVTNEDGTERRISATVEPEDASDVEDLESALYEMAFAAIQTERYDLPIIPDETARKDR